jgi:hypothetical protein
MSVMMISLFPADDSSNSQSQTTTGDSVGFPINASRRAVYDLSNSSSSCASNGLFSGFPALTQQSEYNMP